MLSCVPFSVVSFNWRLTTFEVDSFSVLEQSHKWSTTAALHCEKDEDSAEKVILSLGLKCTVSAYLST